MGGGCLDADMCTEPFHNCSHTEALLCHRRVTAAAAKKETNAVLLLPVSLPHSRGSRHSFHVALGYAGFYEPRNADACLFFLPPLRLQPMQEMQRGAEEINALHARVSEQIHPDRQRAKRGLGQSEGSAGRAGGGG